MNLVFGHDATVNAWLKKTVGWSVDRSPAVSAGVIDANGVLRGALVLTWQAETTAEMHLAGRVSNDVMKQWFRFVFGRAGIHRLEVRTGITNKAIKKAAPKFGFKFESVARAFYGPGRDALVYAMTPEKCRWIDGQSIQGAESADADRP